MEESKNIRKNKSGNNADIIINILPDKEMKKIGFMECGNTYQYCRLINFDSDLCFNLIVNKNNSSDFLIYVFDDDFGQYFDWQDKLEKDSNHELALMTQKSVEKEMEYL
jgi:hypothetical protein